jgi:lipopolysaccharide/colanic/teichoic acid biosynthesis glycosyltransferase
MKNLSEVKGLLTVGNNDARITKTGRWLRKYKLDELPQLWNVLKGDMSWVGPRPEVRKYVDLFDDEQKRVLTVRPGITDYASIEYVNENQLLAQSDNPENFYVDVIMPQKLKINLRYIENKSVKEYFRILFLTGKSIFIQ